VPHRDAGSRVERRLSAHQPGRRDALAADRRRRRRHREHGDPQPSRRERDRPGLGFAQGSAAFDRLNETLAFLNTSFFDAFSPLWYALEHGAEGAGKDALVAFGREKVAKAHADLRARLGHRQWLLGDHRSLADAYFAGIARWADFHQAVERHRYPGLQRLYDRLQDDPAVRFAHAIEEQQAARSSGTFSGHVDLAEMLALLRERA
jgi:glutathione S-transferase